MRTCVAVLLASVLMVHILTGFAVASEPAAEQWFLAEGSGEIRAGNKESAAIDAVRVAMRGVVEQALGVMISSETIVEDSALIKDKILSRVDGYVKKYEIVAKVCERDICTVTIKGLVEKSSLADDVAALAHILPQMNYPAVVVSFTQKALSNDLQSVPLDLKTVETAVAKSLAGKGFRIVNASARDQERLRQAALAEQTAGLTAKAIELAAPISQVVVTGQVLLQDNGGSPYNEKIHSYGAAISAQAYETVTGKLLATSTTNAVAPHISFAIGTQNAALKAADKLANAISSGIVKGWLDACYNEHEVMLVVENLEFGGIEALKAAISSSVNGVQSVTQKSFVRGRAEFGIGWRNCNTASLAGELEGVTVGKDKIGVLETHGNSIRVVLKASN